MMQEMILRLLLIVVIENEAFIPNLHVREAKIRFEKLRGLTSECIL
jgi:hypothetical protein